MTNELTAAAERLRDAAERLRKHESVDYEKSPYFFPDSHYIPGLIDNKKRLADVDLLAHAYLATVAADDELPVDADFIQQVLPGNRNDGDYHEGHYDGTLGYVRWVCLSGLQKNNFYLWVNGSSIQDWHKFSRGDLRHLIRIFGIALQPIAQEQASDGDGA